VNTEEDGMGEQRDLLIPASHGAACIVRRGETIRIVDVEGHQIGDFVCFNLHHRAEKLSTGETVNFNTLAGSGSLHFTVGSRFYSNLQNPMFEIVEDLARGVHDALFAPCSSALYAACGAAPGHRNCRDNLVEALGPHGLGYLDVPDPINLFQHTRTRADGTIDCRPAATQAGEYVALSALMDCLVAVSACPFDLAIEGQMPNGAACSPLRIEFAVG
jgi:uncharacterized protein YcgI (DUF1989 family)